MSALELIPFKRPESVAGVLPDVHHIDRSTITGLEDLIYLGVYCGSLDHAVSEDRSVMARVHYSEEFAGRYLWRTDQPGTAHVPQYLKPEPVAKAAVHRLSEILDGEQFRGYVSLWPHLVTAWRFNPELPSDLTAPPICFSMEGGELKKTKLTSMCAIEAYLMQQEIIAMAKAGSDPERYMGAPSSAVPGTFFMTPKPIKR